MTRRGVAFAAFALALPHLAACGGEASPAPATAGDSAPSSDPHAVPSPSGDGDVRFPAVEGELP